MKKSHVKGPTGSTGLCYKSIADILKHQANLIPDREAFVIYHSKTERYSINFATLFEESRKFAASLHALGIKNRDKVVFYLSNSIEFIIAQFGVIIIGAIPVNTFVTAYGSSDLLTTLKKIKPVALIVEKRCSGTTTDIRDLQLKCTSLKYIIATDVYNDTDECLSYHSLLENDSLNDSTIYHQVNPSDVAMVMKTSGSTGKPKYIYRSYEPFLFLALESKSSIIGEPLKVFSNAYFSYASGYPLTTIKTGITRVTMRDQSETRDVTEHRDLLSVVERECCNYFVMTFCSAKKILAHELRIPGSVKVIVLGGTPLSKEVGKLLDYVPCLRVTYGLLETGNVSAVLVKDKNEMENNIGGYPVNNVEIKIVDEKNCIVDIGVTGKILVRTPFPCSSFMKEGDEEQNIIGKDWIDTRDMGYISENGKLYILGRDIECCTVDDASFFLVEIENTYRDLGIEGIEDLVALPIPDDEYYQRICVCIIRKPGSSLTESEFLDSCKANKVSFILMPKYVVFLDSFPMNATHKIRRHALLEHVMKDVLPGKV